MENADPQPADWVLIESAAKGESDDDFRIVARNGAGEVFRTISGAPALRGALQRLAPRRVILDFHVSFHRGLELLRILKQDFPGLSLLARVRLPNGAHPEPLYFTVEVGTAGVSFHRLSGDDGHDASPPPIEIA